MSHARIQDQSAVNMLFRDAGLTKQQHRDSECFKLQEVDRAWLFDEGPTTSTVIFNRVKPFKERDTPVEPEGVTRQAGTDPQRQLQGSFPN